MIPTLVAGDATFTPATILESITPPTDLAGGGGTIEGRVFGPNDEPESGVYVYLGLPAGSDYQEFNPAYVGDEPYVVTNSQGIYSFTGLPDTAIPGNDYTVSEVVPANQVEAFPNGDMYAVNITYSTTTGFTYTSNWEEGGVPANPSPDITFGAFGGPSFLNDAVESADPAGAVGPSTIIQADNQSFVVYNKTTGTAEESMSLDQFWLPAWNYEAQSGDVDGLDVLMNAYEPQVVFDQASALVRYVPRQQ